MQNRFIIIIAGPNGAGKTTFAREYLPLELGCIEFINADLIAEGLSPFRPEDAAIKAGRLMIQEIDERIHHDGRDEWHERHEHEDILRSRAPLR